MPADTPYLFPSLLDDAHNKTEAKQKPQEAPLILCSGLACIAYERRRLDKRQNVRFDGGKLMDKE